MTVQTIKVGRERFVLLREKDYRQLKAKAEGGTVPKRRRNEPTRPYFELRKELGLE
jgi:hypothetical protein